LGAQTSLEFLLQHQMKI